MVGKTLRRAKPNNTPEQMYWLWVELSRLAAEAGHPESAVHVTDGGTRVTGVKWTGALQPVVRALYACGDAASEKRIATKLRNQMKIDNILINLAPGRAHPEHAEWLVAAEWPTGHKWQPPSSRIDPAVKTKGGQPADDPNLLGDGDTRAIDPIPGTGVLDSPDDGNEDRDPDGDGDTDGAELDAEALAAELGDSIQAAVAQMRGELVQRIKVLEGDRNQLMGVVATARGVFRTMSALGLEANHILTHVIGDADVEPDLEEAIGTAMTLMRTAPE